MGKADTNKELIETAERRQFIFDLRKSGATYRQIAREAFARFGSGRLPQGFDERYAYKDVKRELDKIRADINESAQEVLLMELQRLDAALLGIWPKVQAGDTDAVRTFLRIQQRRSKFLGLDSPTKSHVTIGDLQAMSDAELLDLLDD